ncbi:MAG: OmpA family protein [Phycisphaerae bacterium]
MSDFPAPAVLAAQPTPEPVAPTPAPPPPPAVVEAPPPPPPPPPVVPPPIGTYDPEKGMLSIPSDILFDSGSAVVKADAKAALGKFAKSLARDDVKDRKLTIVGHTDTDRVVKAATIDALRKLGKTPDNMGLSQARAEAVAAILQAGGVDSARMATEGKGALEPVTDNRTPEGKARNRRVEIFLTPAPSARPS